LRCAASAASANAGSEVDAEDGGSPSPRRLDCETSREAVKIENAGIAGQGGDEAPVVALVEEPASLLAGDDVGAEYGTIFIH
jgi:hypothetical protein